jgi:hypothetical protein
MMSKIRHSLNSRASYVVKTKKQVESEVEVKIRVTEGNEEKKAEGRCGRRKDFSDWWGKWICAPSGEDSEGFNLLRAGTQNSS